MITANPNAADDERTILIGTDPAPASNPSSTASEPRAGTWIGAYRLIEPLGEGGMGQVWLAEQREPIQRTVALKLIRRQLAGSLAEAYFEIERQALARMDHPAIAKVLDAGRTPEGFPWFAMERVEGQPLDEWCHQHRPSRTDRLALFVALTYGVQHAHQRGIIHRDLKPANVLVTQVDGRDQPRLIDFGIATGVDNGPGAPATGSYDRVGSGPYMSPEQYAAEHGVDTRTDVYSLGMILLEILLSPPDLATLGRLREEDGRPTTYRRLDESLRNRGSEPLLDAIPVELRYIIAKAVTPQREQRYASAVAIGDDVQRALNNQPVEAVPASGTYRLRKFMRRRWRVMVAAGMMLFALVAGLATALWGLMEARHQAERSQATSNFLATVLSGIKPEWAAQLDKTLLHRVLEQAAERANQDLAHHPDALGDIHKVLSESYFALGELVKSLTHAEQAYQLTLDQFGADDPRTLERANQFGRSLSDNGQAPRALELLRDTLARARRAVGGTDPITLSSKDHIAWALRETGAFQDAYEMADEVARETAVLRGPDAADTLKRRFLTTILLSDLGRYGEAVPVLEDVIERESKTFSDDHPRLLQMRNSLGVYYLQAGRLDQAEETFKRLIPLSESVYGRNSTHPLVSIGSLGNTLRQLGKLDEAETYLQRAEQGMLATFGPAHRRTIMARHNLANLWLDAGRHQDAYDLHKLAYEAAVGSLGERHPQTAGALSGMGQADVRLGRYPHAEEHLLAALALQEAMLASGNPDLERTRAALVELYEAWNRPEQADRYR